jgi:hypothetical protein
LVLLENGNSSSTAKAKLAREFRALSADEHQDLVPREHFGPSHDDKDERNSLRAGFAATRCRCDYGDGLKRTRSTDAALPRTAARRLP